MSVKHCLRFGTHAENKYFMGESSSLYDSIIFNGNMVAYTQAAIAAFIINVNEKGFIIDPQTHAFQHDPSHLKSKDSKGELKVKKSIEQLAEKLGEPISSHLVKDAPITPASFNDATVDSLARGTITFQKGIIDEIKDNGDWEYLEFKLSATGGEEPKPSGLIAPYFYMTETTVDKWININLSLIEASVKYLDGYALMAQLVISKDILTDEEKLKKIIEAYKKSKANFILVWVDSLNEVDASVKELVGLKKLFESLSSSGKQVVNLYGGYFSVMLANKGMLQGVCHGLEYGESRAVVPVGGGIPMAKYYFYPLHFRMRFPDLLTVFNGKGWVNNPRDFGKYVCSCELCIDGEIQKFGITTPVRTRRGANIITLNYPTPETKDYSLRHYLYSKNKEFQTAASKTYEEIKKELETSRDEYEGLLGLEAVSHIDRWITSLK